MQQVYVSNRSAKVNGAIKFNPNFVPAQNIEKPTPSDPFERFFRAGATVRQLIEHGPHSLNWLADASNHNGTFHLVYRDENGAFKAERVDTDHLIPTAARLGFEAMLGQDAEWCLSFGNGFKWIDASGDTWISLEDCADLDTSIPLIFKKEISRAYKRARDARYRYRKQAKREAQHAAYEALQAAKMRLAEMVDKREPGKHADIASAMRRAEEITGWVADPTHSLYELSLEFYFDVKERGGEKTFVEILLAWNEAFSKIVGKKNQQCIHSPDMEEA